MFDAADPAQDRIERLALACLEPFEREGEAAVHRACAGNPADVGAVLAVLRSLSRFGLLGEQPADSGLRPGQQFGDFLLLQRLGGGGMGVVFLAEQLRLHRRVALKLLRPGCLDSQKARARFRREIEVISRLDHPGICTVYEAGEIDDRPYLAMRYVEGETLAARLQRQHTPTPPGTAGTTSSGGTAEALLLVERLARALHHAHEHDVVHRDVKPGNVIVTPDGEPLLLDFGLAIATEEDSSLTRSGDVLGTPAYMAPEQVRGDRGAVDQRTDVHALGVVLYECLAGRPPFTAASRDDLYRQILTEPPPDLRRTVRGVGGELWIVLSRALEKEPRRRFPTALEFAEELQRIRLHQPIRTRRPGPLLRGVHWCQRNPGAAAVLGTALGGLAVALVLLRARDSDLTRMRAALWSREAASIGLREPILGFKLAWQAAQWDASPSNVECLQQMLGMLHERKQIPAGFRPYGVSYSPDGSRLLIANCSDEGFLLYSSDGSRPVCPPLQVEPYLRAPYWPPGATGPASFSHATKELAYGCDAGLVRIVDLDGNEVRFWRHGRPVALVRWSPDDARILVVDSDGGAVLYAPGGERLAALVDPDFGRAHACMPLDAVWSPEGSFLVTADGPGLDDPTAPVDARVWVWDRDGKPLLRLRGPEHAVYRLAASRDRIAAGTVKGQPWLWDLQGTALPSDPLSNTIVTSAAFDRRGTRVVYTSQGMESLRVVDRAGIKLEQLQFGAVAAPVLFTPDDSRLVVASWSGFIQFLNAAHPVSNLLLLAGHRMGITSIALSPDGERLVSVAWDETARIWQLTPVGARWRHGDNSGFVGVVASSDGRRMVSLARSGELVLRDAEGRPIAQPFPGNGELPSSLTLGVDGRTALAAWSNRRLVLWDMQQDRPRELTVPWNHVATALLLPDGRILAAVGGSLMSWDPESGDSVTVLEEPGDSILSLARLPEDRLALGLSGGGILLLAADASQTRLQVPHNSAGVQWLACSRDGRLLLSANLDGTARLWNLPSGQPVQTFEGHQHGLTWCAFLPGDRQVVTGSGDCTLRLFDVATGKGRKLQSHAGFVRPGFVTLDGRQVVSASDDDTIRWSWTDAKGVESAAKQAAEELGIGDLTPAERARLQLPD